MSARAMPSVMQDRNILTPRANDSRTDVAELPAWCGLRRIVVGCDGLAGGLGAVRLASAIASRTGAQVRAVMWLPDCWIEGSGQSAGPVEDVIAAVNEQLAASTSRPELWRLTMTALGGTTIASVCAEEAADLVVLPGLPLGLPSDLAVPQTVPVARVFGGEEREPPRVVLGAGSTPDGERIALAIATIISVVLHYSYGRRDETGGGVEVTPRYSELQHRALDPVTYEAINGRIVLGEVPRERGIPVARMLAIALVVYLAGICALQAAGVGGIMMEARSAAEPASVQHANASARGTAVSGTKMEHTLEAR